MRQHSVWLFFLLTENCNLFSVYIYIALVIPTATKMTQSIANYSKRYLICSTKKEFYLFGSFLLSCVNTIGWNEPMICVWEKDIIMKKQLTARLLVIEKQSNKTILYIIHIFHIHSVIYYLASFFRVNY